ncbi:hypothetical protein [Haloferax sp. YSSS75]|uniref:hypothetical protein n=1 Tax=Haloferax sp. YSSS75 TaxID=3388564 RepID=UPI00398C8D0F
MVPILLVSLGSFIGIVGVLVAYDPSPLCDFRDVDRSRSALDEHSRFVWRVVGLLAALVGTALVVSTLLV